MRVYELSLIFKRGRNAVVFAADKSMSAASLAEKNIAYVKIPDILYRST